MPRSLHRAILCHVLSLGELRPAAPKIPPSFDWDEFADWATKLGILPVLHQKLTAPDISLPVSPNIAAFFEDAYFENLTRNMEAYRQLHTVLQCLRENNIPAIVLKGVFLAQVVYGNIGLRTMGDIDLLVHPDMLGAVEDLLRYLDYSPHPKNDLYAAEDRHLAFLPPDTDAQLPVEIHWDIEHKTTSPLNTEIVNLWQRAETASIAGVPVQFFSPIDMILHLCVHAATHHHLNHYGFRSVYDIALTIQHYAAEIDWTALTTRANAWKVSNGVFLALTLAARTLNAPIPETALAALRPDNFDPLFLAWAEGRIFAGKDTYDPETSSYNTAKMMSARTPAEKRRMALAIVFPSPANLAKDYHLNSTATALFWYPFHWVKMLLRGGKIGFDFLRGNPQTQTWAAQEVRKAQEPVIINWLTER